jgi:carbamoylphosphate synthase large subunit
MDSVSKNSKGQKSSRPRVLLADTNRSPLGPRLAMALAEMGCDVFVVCPSPGHPAVKTGAVRQTLPYSGRTPLESLRCAIEAVNPEAVLPLCDRSVQHLHDLHAQSSTRSGNESGIASLVERSLGSPESFSIVSSRYELLRIARSEGIPVPDMSPITTSADLERWCSEGSAPWVLKADGTWGGRGVRMATTLDEARRDWLALAERPHLAELAKRLSLNLDRAWTLSDWKRTHTNVVAQSYVHGRPANCSIVCWQGKVLASVAVEVVQALGPTEPAMVVEVVDGAEMLSAAEILAGRLHLSGFLGLDFMIDDAAGRTYLIEMNPRITPISSISLGHGRDLVAAYWARLTGMPLRERTAATTKPRIIYFPQNFEKAAPSPDVASKETTYYDVPEGEPELVKALQHPWCSRSWLGRIVDFSRKVRNGEKKSSTIYAVGQRAASANQDRHSLISR